MNIIKQVVLPFSMALFLGASSTVALAEEAEVNAEAKTEEVKSPATNASETIAHLEEALVQIEKGDFSSSTLHVKAARISAKKITGHEDITKPANSVTIQAQIQSRKGNEKKATELVNKALEIYKSL